MTINLLDTLKETSRIAKLYYEQDYDDHCDGTGLTMPTFEDLERFDTEADEVYESHIAKEDNS